VESGKYINVKEGGKVGRKENWFVCYWIWWGQKTVYVSSSCCPPSPPSMPSPFSVCDLTLPKEKSKENQFILGGKSRLEKAK